MLANKKNPATKSSSYHDIILELVEICKSEPNEDKRIEMLDQINSMLLKSDHLSMPSRLTIEFVNMALHRVEGKLLLLVTSK
jgi:hypothetical protein